MKNGNYFGASGIEVRNFEARKQGCDKRLTAYKTYLHKSKGDPHFFLTSFVNK
jgi:hypothetical protein